MRKFVCNTKSNCNKAPGDLGGNMDTLEANEAKNADEIREILGGIALSILKKLVAASVAVAAIAGVAGIKPAAATPSTLGFYPSTDIYGDQVFHFDVDRYSADDFGSQNGGAFDNFGLTYGVGDKEGVAGRTEFGTDYFSNTGRNFGKSLLFNAKTQLYDDATKGVRVVGGVWLAGGKNAGASNTGYLLGSKAFKFGRIHVGVAHAFTDDNIGGKAADNTFLQLGYDRAITPKILFVADYYSGRSLISGVQPTLYYSVNSQASFGLGYFFNSEPKGYGSNNDQLYLCFDYNFGGRKAPDVQPAEGAPGAPGTGAAPAGQ